MSNTAINEEKVIFNSVRQIAKGQERHEYLKQLCGDNQALFDRITKLLDVHDQESSFLLSHTDLAALTFFDQPDSEKPGNQIGPYRLISQLGEGGMGIVFLAEQDEPVRRKVALKLIKPGMDSRQIISRFEVERQTLSLMEHPNIARVLDAGTTELGRPYFVMELVSGIPITQYCDEQQLSIRKRLELFVSVCQAIQHAHLKGIIHRDIKPSNVLVAEYDQTPICKVIDFGVAKAMSQTLADSPTHTRQGLCFGTPSYMSPEQAMLKPAIIDTRSDVYSLGVLLYELLTGTTPLDSQRLRTMDWTDMLKTIREEEPIRPSLKFGRIEQLSKVAAARASRRDELPRQVRGELDWIVMTALEKDRDRRYQTANALAADVQHFLLGEPVMAFPPSPLYRLRKYLGKHKRASTAFVATALFVLVCAVSLCISYLFIQQEKSKAWTAQQEAERRENDARESENSIQTVLDFVQNRFFVDPAKEENAIDLARQAQLGQTIELALSNYEIGFQVAVGAGATTTRVALDRFGNVYATGHFSGTLDFDPGAGTMELISAKDPKLGSESFDCWLAKFSSNGTAIWARRIGGVAADSIGVITVDDFGNVYLGGQVNGLCEFDTGTATSECFESMGLSVLKLDQAGSMIWAKTAVAQTTSQSVTNLRVDSQGNVYAVGSFSEIVDFDPGPQKFELIAPYNQDVFVWKLNKDGEFVWTRQFLGNCAVDDIANALVLDSQNNLSITGHFAGSVDFDPSPDVYELTSSGLYDIFISKLDADGKLIWAKQCGGLGSDFGMAVSADFEDNIYTTGSFTQISEFGHDQHRLKLPCIGKEDVFICKHTSQGELDWVKQIGGKGRDQATAITNDAQQNVIVTGSFQDTVDFDPGSGKFLRSAISGGLDPFILSLDNRGSFVSAIRFGGHKQGGECGGIAIGDLGNLFLGAFINGGRVIELVKTHHASLQRDRFLISGSALVVRGGIGNDKFLIRSTPDKGVLEVWINDISKGRFAPTARVVVFGMSGNDSIQIGDHVSLPVSLYGQDGDDELVGGSGFAFIDGGLGDDQLIGGTDRNFLIGGPGSDRIFGGMADDLIIAGSTNFEELDRDLQASFSNWIGLDSHEKRIMEIFGVERNAFAKPVNVYDPLQVMSAGVSTFCDDHASDHLTGFGGRDCFCASAKSRNERGDDTSDKIMDQEKSEFTIVQSGKSN